MKEIDPVWGGRVPGALPGSANANNRKVSDNRADPPTTSRNNQAKRYHHKVVCTYIPQLVSLFSCNLYLDLIKTIM